MRNFLPDAVNGPDMVLGQNAGMGRLLFFPDEAGRYRPMDSEDEGIPISQRDISSNDIKHQPAKPHNFGKNNNTKIN